ncbi:copper resistance protein CopC [Nocardioides zeae]|uniref:Copper resistance protein CopC n=1 Tax=Nocardioides imazamoxiresistens TaxID=3231893 RepID=A0ABU3PVC8_9ACTN|nr:copper resistance protein CopC [Nocardioides zeae]MDT9593176.1 copper resistance protein CopC [Nocardioides zeae]
MTRPTTRGTARGLAALALALLPALAGVLALGGAFAPAQAHATLSSSDPAADSSVAQLPEEVSLTFNQEMRGPAYVLVTGPDGEAADGDPTIDGTTVTQAVTPGAAGTYTIAYRVVSADGHPVSGEIPFEITEGTGSAGGSEGSGAADGATDDGAGDPQVDGETIESGAADEAAGGEQGWWSRHGDHVLIFGGLFVVAGGLLYGALRRNPA